MTSDGSTTRPLVREIKLLEIVAPPEIQDQVEQDISHLVSRDYFEAVFDLDGNIPLTPWSPIQLFRKMSGYQEMDLPEAEGETPDQFRHVHAYPLGQLPDDYQDQGDMEMEAWTDLEGQK